MISKTSYFTDDAFTGNANPIKAALSSSEEEPNSSSIFYFGLTITFFSVGFVTGTVDLNTGFVIGSSFGRGLVSGICD